VSRSFDVYVTPKASAEIESFGESKAGAIVETLTHLKDADLFDAERIEGWRRGPLGSWILLNKRGWHFICQWDSGIPNLWHLRLGRGRLTVETVAVAIEQ
jgi:hypothetical protein